MKVNFEFLKHLSIKQSIFALFAVLSALHFAFGIFTFRPLIITEHELTDLKTNNIQTALTLSKIERAFWHLRLNRAKYSSMTLVEREESRLQERVWERQIDDGMAAYASMADTVVEKENLLKWNEAYQNFYKNSLHLMFLIDREKISESQSFRVKEVTPFAERASTYLEKLTNYQGEEAVIKEQKAVNYLRQSQVILSLLAFLSTLLSSFVTWYAVNLISKNHQQKLIALGKMFALGNIASNIAHEMNSPLTVLKLSTEQMELMLEENKIDPIQLRGFSTKINSSTQRISKIISGLRAFTKSSEVSNIVTFKIKDVVEETLSLCLAKARKTGVEITIGKIPDDLVLEGLPSEISHVIFNLLDNAIDAVSALSERWIVLSVSEIADSIEISIIDSGAGIPKNIRSKIFKESITTKGVGVGAGFGLGICNKIVETHHGQIFVDEKCKNTRFVIQIPKHSSQELRVA